MLACGLDYSCDRQSWAGKKPLDTRYSFDMMIGLGQACGATTVRTLWNKQCTRAGLLAAIREVGQRCRPEDYFVFYYTGHGETLMTNSLRKTGGKDQCFCLVDQHGNADDTSMTYRQQVWMRDHEFASNLLASVIPQAKIIVLVDACHSGTICDFDEIPEWRERRVRAVSISGCEDSQTAAGTGRGGQFTRALTRAIQKLQQDGEKSYSTGKLFNRTLMQYRQHKLKGHSQNLSVHGCAVRPQDMVWPLQPRVQYVSPANCPPLCSVPKIALPEDRKRHRWRDYISCYSSRCSASQPQQSHALQPKKLWRQQPIVIPRQPARLAQQPQPRRLPVRMA